MVFVCQQHDNLTSLTRYYVLSYYYEDKSIEMLEQKTGRLYLKRFPSTFPEAAFFIGATLNVFGKTTKILAYADQVTTEILGKNQEATTVIIAEVVFESLGRYISMLMEECGFTVANIQMSLITLETAEAYDVPPELAKTRVVIVQCTTADAIEMGSSFMQRASGTYAARDAAQAITWGKLAVEASVKPLAVRRKQNSSVVVFKPSVVASKRVGSAIQQLIATGLELTGLTKITLTSNQMHKFLTPYHGILRDMDYTVAGFVGDAWVMQLVSLDDTVSAISCVREVCGPYDSVIARKLYPKSIRGRFGKDHVDNVLHCCDLEGEGPLYADFFFSP